MSKGKGGDSGPGVRASALLTKRFFIIPAFLKQILSALNDWVRRRLAVLHTEKQSVPHRWFGGALWLVSRAIPSPWHASLLPPVPSPRPFLLCSQPHFPKRQSALAFFCPHQIVPETPCAPLAWPGGQMRALPWTSPDLSYTLQDSWFTLCKRTPPSLLAPC